MIIGADGIRTTDNAGLEVIVQGKAIGAHFGALDPITATITAFATGGQTNATQLAAIYNNVTTVATAADSVKLPVAQAGMVVRVRNSAAANAVAVYPQTGGIINALAANASISIPAGQEVIFSATTTGQWYSNTTALINGVNAVAGQTVSPRLCHTGNTSPQTTTTGTSTTPVATETYIAEVIVPANCTITGIAISNAATVGTDKYVAYLCDSTGAVVANSALAGTTTAGAAAFQRLPLTAPYAAKGPATYYVALQVNGTTDRFRSHAAGNFGASKGTGTVFGTLASITAPTTFTADLGPIASLY